MKIYNEVYEKYINMTVEECLELPTTMKQYARQLAVNYPDQFKSKDVLEMILDESFLSDLSRINSNKPVREIVI